MPFRSLSRAILAHGVPVRQLEIVDCLTNPWRNQHDTVIFLQDTMKGVALVQPLRDGFHISPLH